MSPYDDTYPRMAPVPQPEPHPGAEPKAPGEVARDTSRGVNRSDGVIWGIYAILCTLSVVELFSASSHEVTAGNIYAPLIRHLVFLGAGFGLMLWLQRVGWDKFYRVTWPVVVLSMLMMVYVMFFGDILNNARRSFSIGPIRVFPAELIKFSVVMAIAWCMTRYRLIDTAVTRRRMVNLSIAVTVLSAALLFSQGLTNTILLVIIAMAMMIVGGIGGKQIMALILVFAVLGGAGMAYKRLQPQEEGNRSGMWVKRLTGFMEPNKWADTVKITDENAQEQYSYIAQAHGGVLGVLPGNSRETSRLSLAFSDYIFAIIVEELGLVGGIALLLCYLLLLTRAAYIAYRCQHTYPALLILGMALFIVLQAMFHMSIVTGAGPVSGQPLPLFSKGGTSILITSVALGMMLSVSRNALRSDNKQQISDTMRSLPHDVRALNLSQDK